MSKKSKIELAIETHLKSNCSFEDSIKAGLKEFFLSKDKNFLEEYCMNITTNNVMINKELLNLCEVIQEKQTIIDLKDETIDNLIVKLEQLKQSYDSVCNMLIINEASDKFALDYIKKNETKEFTKNITDLLGFMETLKDKSAITKEEKEKAESFVLDNDTDS